MQDIQSSTLSQFLVKADFGVAKSEQKNETDA